MDESDSTIPDPNHQIVTTNPPVIAPVTEFSSPKFTPPPINTEATTITTSLPEITPFIALQLRVAILEQEMSEIKKTHSADVLASIKSQVPTVVDKYLGTKLDDALLGLYKNQESEKSPKEIIRIKREQGEEKQESTYSIRSTDKVALEEFDLKSALFKHMNKNKTANRNPANYHLYHALMEALIADEDAMDKEVAVKGRSAKRRRPNSAASGSAQPPPKDDDQSSKKPRESDASASKQHPALTSTGWQITDTRDAVVDSSMHRSDPESEHSEQSSDDILMQDERHVSDLEDTDNAHIPKTIPLNDFPEPENNWANTYATTYQVPAENKLQRKTYDIRSFIKWFCRRTGKKKICKADLEGPAFNLVKSFHKNSVSLQFQMDECYKLLTDKVDLVNPEGHQILRNVYEPLPLGGPPGQVSIQPQFFFNKDLEYLLSGDKERKTALSISKLKAARYLDFGLEELVPSLWVESERDYDISAAYGITHWWVRRKEFYINKHREPSDRDAVRSHMRILSVICIKTYERYGYNYLREIVLRRADYKEYKISEKDFKNLHPNDFEDLFLLHLQDKLNHLPKSDKVNLHTAVNMWIRNIVIRKRVEDLQLGVESYQTKLNLEQPNWDASDFLFKEDYTIVNKPRAVIYRDRDDNKKMMRINEVHKFSDGTLMRIRNKLDFMVKDFRLFKFNKGMETRKWTKDDKRRSEDFIEVIEKRLKIRRIFQSLESFVGGRLRDIDYRLISRTGPHKGVKASANSDVMYFFTSAQDGDPSQDDVRLCLGDDLKKAQDHSKRQAGKRKKGLSQKDGTFGATHVKYLLAFQGQGQDTPYLLLYVDDIILTASSTSLLQRIISLLHAEFAMTDLGPLKYFLGISATCTTYGIFLSQTKYATEILEQAQMLNYNPCRTSIDTEKKLGPEGSPVTDPTLYRSLAGSLQYLTFTRPDLSYAVQQLCLYMHDPRAPHLDWLNIQLES
ncbi:retrovirus-related pol polyprotein from transposon TNT 1-94, partial [Tanacetum coccineum]